MTRKNIGYLIMVWLKQAFDIDPELIAYLLFISAFIIASSKYGIVYIMAETNDFGNKLKALFMKEGIFIKQYKGQSGQLST